MTSKPNLITIPDRSGPGIKTAAPVVGLHLGGSGEKWATGGEQEQNQRNSQHLRIAKQEVTIGTWNVRSLSATGKLNELENEMGNYTWNILGIAEMRWIGNGEIISEDGHKVWWSGDEKKLGVGFIVHRKILNTVMEYCNEDELGMLYHQFEATTKNIPKKDMFIVKGDWNAKIGSDAHAEWPGTAGKFALGCTNERGLRLLEFAKIDYILIEKKCFSSINGHKTRSFPGADVGSDHNLVMTTMKLKLKIIQQPPSSRIKYDTSRLKNAETLETFRSKIGGKFAPLLEMTEIQEVTDLFTEGMN
ncbi:craniofacial development protein 2-like [Penaeus vannamei]|uniref:craniofacial development protein 2-like n=1 Tax=Penaeus vannamei TaxID=6689 RepID=UPI00387F62BF